MQWICSPYEPSRYATNLRHDKLTNMLVWDSAPGQSVLIVQTPFGQSAVKRMTAICKSLSGMPGLPNQYTEVAGDSWIIAVSAADKLRNKGCPLNGCASTYTVFSFSIEDDGCHIYEPEERVKLFVQASIPMDIRIDIAQECRKKGIGFWGKSTPTGFYSIAFPKELAGGYVDGDLQFRVGDFMIPVTSQMLAQRTVFIKSERKPAFVSQNPGLRIAD